VRLDDFALGVQRRRRDAEADARAIALRGFEQKAREFRRFAKANRQQSRSERVERAGVTRLFCTEDPLDAHQRHVRRDAGRLVEQQHAVDASTRRTARRWR
jgi:hypothetical protein